MEKGCIEYNGAVFPTIYIELDKVSDIDSDEIVTLADLSLWDAIEEDYWKGDSVAVSIDDDVYFYCDYDVIDGMNSESDVIEYMKIN